MYMAKKLLGRLGQWRAGFFQQPDEFGQFGPREVAQELAVQGGQRLVQPRQRWGPNAGPSGAITGAACCDSSIVLPASVGLAVGFMWAGG